MNFHTFDMKMENNNMELNKMFFNTGWKSIYNTNFLGNTMKFDTEQEGEEETKFELCKILQLVKDQKISIIIGIIGGLIYGAYIPFVSLFLGKITTSFALKDNDEMRKEVLKWACVLIALALFWVLFYYIQD